MGLHSPARWLAPGVALWAIACAQGPGHGTTTGEPADSGCALGPARGDLPCDVAAVLKSKCQPCHQTPPQNGAHFPLLNYEDTQAPLGAMRRWQRMAEVTRPDGLPHMPAAPGPPLTDAEFVTLQTWFSACAPPKPEGQGCDLGE